MSTETILRPTGTGDLSEAMGELADGSDTYPEWVGMYTLVDEETFSSDKIKAVSTEKRCLFTFTPGTLGSIIEAVTVHAKCAGRWVDGNSHNAYYRPCLKSGGTIAYGNQVNPPPYTNWTEYSQEFTTNPVTGVAWTLSDLSSLQAGPALSSNSTSMWSYCGQFWLVIRHRPSSQCRAQIIGLGW